MLSNKINDSSLETRLALSFFCVLCLASSSHWCWCWRASTLIILMFTWDFIKFINDSKMTTRYIEKKSNISQSNCMERFFETKKKWLKAVKSHSENKKKASYSWNGNKNWQLDRWWQVILACVRLLKSFNKRQREKSKRERI